MRHFIFLFLIIPAILNATSYWPGSSKLLPATIYCKDGTRPQGYGYFFSNEFKPEFGRSGRGAIFVLDGVKYRSHETDSIRINMIPGCADSVGWRFRIITGEISAFRYAPVYDGEELSFLQKGTGDIVAYSEYILREMVSPCTTALSYLAIESPGEAIISFNSYKEDQYSYKLVEAYQEFSSEGAGKFDRLRLKNALKVYKGYYPLPDDQVFTPNCTMYLKNGSTRTGFACPSLHYSEADMKDIQQQRSAEIFLGVVTGLVSFAATGGQMIAIVTGGFSGNEFGTDTRYLNYLPGPAFYASPLEQSMGKPVLMMNKKAIDPGCTDSILFNIHTGVPCDSFWSFKVISGRINAWSRFPIPFASKFTYLQKDGGPRLPYSDRLLLDMVRDNICASLTFKSIHPDSIRIYRTLTEYNHPSLAFKPQLDSINAICFRLNKNTFAYQREEGHLASLWTRAKRATHSDSAWKVINGIKDPRIRLEQTKNSIAMDSTYSPALALLGDLVLANGDTASARMFYQRSLKYSQRGYVFLNNIYQNKVIRFENRIRSNLIRLGTTPTY